MASHIAPHTHSIGTTKPHKILTAGFNSPVPECTLQVSNQSHPLNRKPYAVDCKANRPRAGFRFWFERLLDIF